MRFVVPLLLLALSACGGSSTATDCGGDLSGTWRFDAVSFEAGAACGSGAPAVEGTLTFNANGRYSLVLTSQAWVYAGAGGCGFSKAYGGFYKVTGAQVCFAMNQADLGACDESTYRPEAPENAAGTYCVEGGALSLRSRTFAGLSSAAVLRLVR